MRIPATFTTVSGCWERAEKSLQRYIRKYHPDADEVFITKMFHGKLAKELTKASRQCLVAQAFLGDLTDAFPDLACKPELHSLAHGLIADVTLHGHKTETVTGGDFGFMICRPQVEDQGKILKVGDYRRRILCQAKRKNPDGEWGEFTTNQEKVLPKSLQYLGLLLYSYKDKERRHLRQFE